METVAITGANRGIGLELTRRFAASGRQVIAACRNPEEASGLLVLEGVEPMRLDVADKTSVADFAGLLTGRPIDVLINNAGVMSARQGLDNMDDSAWLESFAINTIAPFRLSVSLKENLLKSDRPRIVTISSQMGALSRKSVGAYAYRSSKAAVNKVMQVLAMELKSEGIIVCPVHPGWVRTDMGGSAAEISVQESAAGLIALIDGLTLEQSGRFWTWAGDEHDW